MQLEIFPCSFAAAQATPLVQMRPVIPSACASASACSHAQARGRSFAETPLQQGFGYISPDSASDKLSPQGCDRARRALRNLSGHCLLWQTLRSCPGGRGCRIARALFLHPQKHILGAGEKRKRVSSVMQELQPALQLSTAQRPHISLHNVACGH